MRNFKIGDVVPVNVEEIEALHYVPNFPEEITSTQGRITSDWRLTRYNDGWVTVQLDMCPRITNLQFQTKDITLLYPVELDERLTAIEDRLTQLERKK